MRIRRQVPLNPNIVVYHVDVPLTTAVVDVYREASSAPRPFAELLSAGAVSVHAMRYRLQVRKPDEKDMLAFLGELEPCLCEWAGEIAILPADAADRWREFPVDKDPTLAGEREVYEGSDAARTNPLARALFAEAGVAEVVLTPDAVRIGKAALFEWNELAPRVEHAISVHRRTRGRWWQRRAHRGAL
jgi:hypothetical protein